ncbi:MAG: putative hydro-lyase [Alphaproteobacteria bacterium]|nr:putative hydro-lyase [Alphaproteobacteria bacterium]MBT7943503.1 putative hydro-lyase [Alphaproteobacteria bacterium]
MIREERFDGNTSGFSLGFLQGNLAILPAEYAMDFQRYCQRNPKPCPLVGVSDTGEPALPTLGRDIDIRTDIPSYNVYRGGELAEQTTNITDLWQDDFVSFIIGCSYTFENALMAEGVSLRHIDEDKTVSMFNTNIQTTPAGPFSGGTVVSMRPLSVEKAIRAIEITSRFPQAHGTPVHFGNPEEIGIADISKPDWGDPSEIRDGEVPVFWACGVTPQAAVRNAKPSICITHSPGSMLITDIPGMDAGRGQLRA